MYNGVKYGDQCIYSDAELGALVKEHGPFLMRFLKPKLTKDQFDEVLNQLEIGIEYYSQDERVCCVVKTSGEYATGKTGKYQRRITHHVVYECGYCFGFQQTNRSGSKPAQVKEKRKVIKHALLCKKNHERREQRRSLEPVLEATDENVDASDEKGTSKEEEDKTEPKRRHVMVEEGDAQEWVRRIRKKRASKDDDDAYAEPDLEEKAASARLVQEKRSTATSRVHTPLQGSVDTSDTRPWTVGGLCKAFYKFGDGFIYRVKDITHYKPSKTTTLTLEPVFSSFANGGKKHSKTRKLGSKLCTPLSLADIDNERSRLEDFIAQEQAREAATEARED